jgi:alpha-N-arabinofuranosidase
MRIIVRDKVLHEVSPLLFGHFVEHANWHGEIGADTGLVDRDTLAPRVKELIASLSPLTLRFPGGTLVCNSDWLDFLNNAPTEEHDRWGLPDVQTRYTFDGFLRDCETWGAAPVLVVNFKKALVETQPLADCAEHAAALVAYCNLAVDADAPESLLRWAKLRAANGRVEPYGVKYYQIGNEIWAYSHEAREKRGGDYPRWYAECLDAYITAMRAVDPGIVLISDGANTAVNQAIRDRVGDRLDYMTSHVYGPWALREIKRDGRAVDPQSLSDADVWRAFVSVADMDPQTGMSYYPLHFDADTSGYPIAATEWNWNGWWELQPVDGGGSHRPMDCFWAKGIGAASFIHGLIRGGERIKLAHQSMLIGVNWGITTVRIPPEGPDKAYLIPSGAITGFYARHHGDRRLDAVFQDVPSFSQPYAMGTITPQDKVAVVDAVVTADDAYVYVHLISRAFDRPTPINVDVSALAGGEGEAVLYTLEGKLQADPPTRVPMRETANTVAAHDGVIGFVLPPRVVACLRVAR